MFDEITASNLVKVDVDGKILEPSPYPVQEAGFVIHSAIHMARPDVQCVLHNHTRAGMTFSMLKEGLMPLSQHAMMFHDKVTYHDSEGFAVDLEERRRLAEDLGDKPVMILRNHGPLIAASTIPQAFNMMFNLQKAMESQLDALATGHALNIPPEQVAEQIAGYVYRKDRAGQELTDTVDWPALLRMLDRKDSSFRD
jgi:ribulose-5-phosphate 4-epimerase/fuculose-1-phosphate aldolase